MKLNDINDELGTDLDSEDYDSIGGLIIESLDRLPDEGESITTPQGIVLKVSEVNQNRIVKVLMTLPEEEDVADEEPDEEGKKEPGGDTSKEKDE